MKKVFLSFILSLFVVVPVFSLMVSPVEAGPNIWGDKEKIRGELGYDADTEIDPRIVAARIIQIFMTFLGIISVAIILWGGFRWMTSGGNDEQVGEARKILISGVIGLIIILSAWAIADWVIVTINTEILE